MSLQSRTHRPGSRPVRLAYLVSHPIQYQTPLLRRIAQEPDIDLTVFFGSDHSVRGYKDEGFGVPVKWDVPLLDGYRSIFLPKLRDNDTVGPFSPISRSIVHHLRPGLDRPGFDALWVHGYASVNALHGILAAKALGIPVLLRAESWLRDRGRGGVKLALKHMFFGDLRHLVAAVLPIGTYNSQYWRYYFGRDVPQFLMPYAVDNEYFASRAREAGPTRGALQAELQLQPHRPVILFASKLQGRKHCDDLIAAFAKVHGTLQPAPYLVIVGDGEQRPALEQQASATGLSDSIRFCGFRNQSELPRFFDLCTVFVLPSRHEPWGLIVNEVMNAGRAVIVTDDVGAAPDLVQNGVNGGIYPAGDIDALVTALRDTLGTPGRAEAMGQQSAARIAQWGFEQDIEGLRHALAHVAPGFAA
jgi:glycosyltransferase involved in cell wall biosynthesis